MQPCYDAAFRSKDGLPGGAALQLTGLSGVRIWTIPSIIIHKKRQDTRIIGRAVVQRRMSKGAFLVFRMHVIGRAACIRLHSSGKRKDLTSASSLSAHAALTPKVSS